MKTKPTVCRWLVFAFLLVPVRAQATSATAPSAPAVAPANSTPAVSAIPAVVLELPAYKAIFKNFTPQIYAEGALSPTRRFLVLDRSLFFVVLDLNQQTNRWEVAFSRGIEKTESPADNARVFHRNNQFVALWNVWLSQDKWKSVCLRVNDQSTAFEVKEYPTTYASYFWDEATGELLGVGMNGGGPPNLRIVIGSLDGRNQVFVDKIERLFSSPFLMRPSDATTYRLWLIKSVLPLANADGYQSQNPNGGRAIHCVTLRKTATGYQVVDDKFVAYITSGNRNSAAIHGYLDVEDKGATYKLSLKTHPMGDGVNHDRVIGEFAY
jgi:hypothetical protein